ncbi:MAG TPA: four helix bundle protein [Candidatus Saccharimonadales bacterium]|nr:four helix bundle protein [Candidatus Saccharimonadales bacterium]
MDKINSFTQLRTWQQAREFAVAIYKLTTTFPSSEKFGLIPQMRRSSISVAANIAEGFSRDGQQDKKRFYAMSMGSLTEALSHAYIAHDLGFIKPTDLQLIETKVSDLHKMLNGMIKKAPGRNT